MLKGMGCKSSTLPEAVSPKKHLNKSFATAELREGMFKLGKSEDLLRINKSCSGKNNQV